MANRIHLLPDRLANQIAAGEVVQRPASVVKELLENAIDAGADTLTLELKEAGKVLIRVTDNGSGMNLEDARMCFERHATSKIRETEDLFRINTMGFRGEALASIAAVARVTLKTRVSSEELGTEISLEGSTFTGQKAVQCPVGSSFSVSHLFYNVPARRNFLKSNAVECRHAINEFLRIALAYPDRGFTLIHNDIEVYKMKGGSEKDRLMAVFGNDTPDQVVSFSEETPYFNLRGFVGKAEYARKSRGDQYFFVNNRFIRDNYLNHAVISAFGDRLSSDTFPLYVIFIEIDPSRVDINIHPTKHEIKFDDEKTAYSLLHSVIRKAVAGPVFFPMQEQTISQSSSNLERRTDSWSGKFKELQNKGSNTSGINEEWKSLFGAQQSANRSTPLSMPYRKDKFPEGKELGQQTLRVLDNYLITEDSEGILIINLTEAHRKVFYSRLAAQMKPGNGSQQLLFPQVLKLKPEEWAFMDKIQQHLQGMGFDLKGFGSNAFLVSGLPAAMPIQEMQPFFLSVINEIMEDKIQFSTPDLHLKLAASIAKRITFKPEKNISEPELSQLLETLFQNEDPEIGVTGNPVFFRITKADLEKRFTHA